MPPKKAAKAAPKKAASPAGVTKKPRASKAATSAKRASITSAASATSASSADPVTAPKAAPKKAAPKKVPVAAKGGKASAAALPPNPPKKRKASEESEDEPKSKKAKSVVAEPAPAPRKASVAKSTTAKKAAAKPAPKKVAASKPKVEVKAKPAPKPKAAPKAKAEPKAKPAPKTPVSAAPRRAKAQKAAPILNARPTQLLDVYCFGENGNGELGLGAKNARGRMVIDVGRPRLNPFLAAKEVGIVAIAVGGMHCAALTHDNKILTWGVNDQGALGRPSDADPEEVKMKDADASDSDSDDDFDEDSGLNPAEAEPRPVDPSHFPEGTEFAGLYAGDSNTFALTTTGLVYGWGTFRGNDGILGFTNDIKVATTPILIPDLKNIVDIVTGTNHVIALDNKGKCFIWGAGEQNQLGRRVVSRTATGALVPREFGLQRKKIAHIGAGDYHSFAVTEKGDVYAWGLNSFGQCGIPKVDEDDDTVAAPTVVKSLKSHSIKQISGGAHHTIALTEAGQVLAWGRSENKQCGVDVSKLPQIDVFYDKDDKPRYLFKPTVVPDIKGATIATATDTAIAIDVDGKAYSWGFNGNLQTGQGSADDIPLATLVDNTAVRGKKLTWAGVGGQFGVLAGPHVEAA